MHKQMEAAKQVFGDDLNIAQLNLKCLEAWGEQINSQRTSGEKLGADKQRFLATLSKGLDLLHEAYVEFGRQRVLEYLVAKEQCSRSELLAMDDEGLEEIVAKRSTVVKEQISQHQVVVQQANQQCEDSMKEVDVLRRGTVDCEAKFERVKAIVARGRAG